MKKKRKWATNGDIYTPEEVIDWNWFYNAKKFVSWNEKCQTIIESNNNSLNSCFFSLLPSGYVDP
jgi:hypothetical protein